MNAEPDPADLTALTRPEGPPSGFTCPECRGPLWELREGARQADEHVAVIRRVLRMGESVREEVG